MNIFNNLFKKQTSTKSSQPKTDKPQSTTSKPKSAQKTQQQYQQPSNPWAAEETAINTVQTVNSQQSTAVSNLSNPPSMNSLKSTQASEQQQQQPAPKSSGGMFGKLKKNKANNATTSSDSSQNIHEASDNNISSSPAIAPDAYSTSPAVSEQQYISPSTELSLSEQVNNVQVPSKKPLFAKFSKKTQSSQNETDSFIKDEEKKQDQNYSQIFQQSQQMDQTLLNQSSQESKETKQFEGLSFIERSKLKKKLAEEMQKKELESQQNLAKEEEEMLVKTKIQDESQGQSYVPQCFQESSDEETLKFNEEKIEEDKHVLLAEKNSEKEQHEINSEKSTGLNKTTSEKLKKEDRTYEDQNIVKQQRDVSGEMEEEKKQLSLRLTEVFLTQHTLMSTKSRLEAEIKRLKKENIDLSRLQNQHAENDRFEEAEAIEEQIKEIIEQIQAAERSTLDTQQEYNQLDNQKEQIHQEEINSQERWLTILSDLKKNSVHEKEEYESEMNQKLKKERKEIEEETERINIRQAHLELDNKQLLEERENIKESVAKQCGDMTVEQQAIEDKQKELTKEVESLRRQLQKKEQELLEVKTAGEEIKQKIAGIQQKFENQSRRLDTKSNRLNEEQRNFSAEKEQLELLQKNNEMNQKNFTNKLQALQDISDGYHAKRNALSEQILQNKRVNEARESALSKYADSYAGYVGFNKTLEQDELQAESLDKQKQQLDESISELLAKTTQLQEKIPVLESEKKALVGQKAFKQAGLVANDIKDVIVQVEETQKEIEVQKKEEQQIVVALEQIQQRKASSDNQLRQLRKLADIDKYTLLLLKLTDLEGLKVFAEEQKKNQSANTLQDEMLETQREIERIKQEYPEVDQSEKIKNKNDNNYDGGDEDEEEKKQNITDNDLDAQKQVNLDGSVKNNSEEDDGDDDDSDTSNQLTEADLDSKLKELVQKIKDITAQLMQHEDSITHCVEAEEYEKADQLQQVIETLTKKLDRLKDKLSTNYSCLNLEEAEGLILNGGNKYNTKDDSSQNKEIITEKEKDDIHVYSDAVASEEDQEESMGKEDKLAEEEDNQNEKQDETKEN